MSLKVLVYCMSKITIHGSIEMCILLLSFFVISIIKLQQTTELEYYAYVILTFAMPCIKPFIISNSV